MLGRMPLNLPGLDNLQTSRNTCLYSCPESTSQLQRYILGAATNSEAHHPTSGYVAFNCVIDIRINGRSQQALVHGMVVGHNSGRVHCSPTVSEICARDPHGHDLMRAQLETRR